MLKALISTSVLTLSLLAAPVALAEDDKTYIGVSAVLDSEIDNIDLNTGYGLSIGRVFSDNLSAELQYVNLIDLGDSGSNVETDFMALAGFYHFGSADIRPFVKLAYAEFDLKVDSASYSEDDFGYGVGVDLPVGDTTLRLDYSRYEIDGDYEAFNLALLAHF